ncbi:hypothetical protein GPL21_37300 [Bradyrhizobium pachyrhizi]|uniref:Uncharacterized protein n=1 Tax=Bradyrhizobium pachyrhizi TaxID=280333 RepID=A0A844SUK0_9BRAD|nr:hypothetical protein [Bradyrhizobium pachyrhizi]MVT70723.1 hypothetical protein [Bradyrhizobium pachyrhizi]
MARERRLLQTIERSWTPVTPARPALAPKSRLATVVEDAFLIHPNEAATMLAPGLVLTTPRIGSLCRAALVRSVAARPFPSHLVLTLAGIGLLTRFALAARHGRRRLFLLAKTRLLEPAELVGQQSQPFSWPQRANDDPSSPSSSNRLRRIGILNGGKWLE